MQAQGPKHPTIYILYHKALTVGDDGAWLQPLHCNVAYQPAACVEVPDQVVCTILQPDAPQAVVHASAAATELQTINLCVKIQKGEAASTCVTMSTLHMT
jgi:hypothetical protein